MQHRGPLRKRMFPRRQSLGPDWASASTARQLTRLPVANDWQLRRPCTRAASEADAQSRGTNRAPPGMARTRQCYREHEPVWSATDQARMRSHLARLRENAGLKLRTQGRTGGDQGQRYRPVRCYSLNASRVISKPTLQVNAQNINVARACRRSRPRALRSDSGSPRFSDIVCICIYRQERFRIVAKRHRRAHCMW